MNPADAGSPNIPSRIKWGWLWVMLASLATGLAALSTQSFWIDEPFTARYAVQPHLADWWGLLRTSLGPDVQMLVYTLYLWGWEKLFGHSEYALRAANLPWFLLAQTAFWVGLRRWPSLRLAAVIFGAFNPFFWRFLDELRPYAMEYAGSAMVASCLAWLAGARDIPPKWLLAFGTGLFVLCGSSTLGIPWAGAAVLAFAGLTWGSRRLVWDRAAVLASLGPGIALTALAGYYVWTIPHGLGGAHSVGHPVAVLCFAFYELAGFDGLGPGRIDISNGHTWALFFPYLAILVPAGLLFGSMIFFAAQSFRRRTTSRERWAATTYLGIPMLLLVSLTFCSDWHATGRHYMPASSVIVLAAALAGATACRERSPWKLASMAAFLLCWILACMELRLAARHLRDDYRDAALYARTALGKRENLWWFASDVAGTYYGVPLSSHPEEGKEGLFLWHPLLEDLEARPAPDCVVLSKPPLFDPNDAVAGYLAVHHYRQTAAFPAFSIWEH